jgi:hypothetical protein
LNVIGIWGLWSCIFAAVFVTITKTLCNILSRKDSHLDAAKCIRDQGSHVLFNVVTLKLNILNMGHGIHLGPENPGAVPRLFQGCSGSTGMSCRIYSPHLVPSHAGHSKMQSFCAGIRRQKN